MCIRDRSLPGIRGVGGTSSSAPAVSTCQESRSSARAPWALPYVRCAGPPRPSSRSVSRRKG
eukprot:9516565-Prorocentrum_lima.AAC.1